MCEQRAGAEEEEEEACAEGWAGEDCDECAAGHSGERCLPDGGGAASEQKGKAREGPERVHVLCTICGQDYVAKTLPMLRSLLWHRSTPLTLHIIADRPARRQLAKDFGEGWGSAALEVDYIHAEQHVDR